jgi:acetylornithine aminotransferase
VFIADSVQCGYGRSGVFFAHDHAGINADIYSMAKGMGNGFPIGGILIAAHIKPKYGLLGTTFGGNQLACAAALAVLDVIEQDNLLANAATIGAYLQEELKKITALQNVRGKGLMIGFDVPEQLKDLKKTLLTEFKVFTGEAKPNIIRLLPSLALTKVQADEFLVALKSAIEYLTPQP